MLFSRLPRPAPTPLPSRGGEGSALRLIALACALALSACGGTQSERPVSAFEGKVLDWTRELIADSPELATARAVPAELAGDAAVRLDDRSPAAEEMRRTAAFRRDAELRALEPREIPPDQRRTYDILKEQFSAMAALSDFSFGTFAPLDSHSPYVLDQQSSAFLELPDFFDSRITVATLQDGENYVARLRQVPAALDGETARARQDADAGILPPDFIIDRTLQMLDAANSTPLAQQIYLSSLRRKLDALAPPGEAGAPLSPERRRAQVLYGQAEAIVRDRIIPAQIRTAQMLRSIRPRATHDAGVWRLPNGDAYYAAALRQQTTTTLSADEIHAIGLARVRELNALADVALRRVGLAQGTVGERLAQLTRDPQYQYPSSPEGRDQLIADVNARVQAILRRAPEWFGTLPRAQLEVRRVPLANELSASGAYYESPALDGSLPGVYYINLRNMAEMTRIDLPTQDFHETVPGHHFQTALAQEQEGLPLLRRLMSFAAYEEGWGLYAEQLADEQEFYANDPIGRIGYLRWQLWRAARLVVDTGLHAKRWSREQAIEYIVATTGDQPGVAISEVERYVASPGQACAYELGRREIARLRDVARRALGDKFDLRAFHDVVLLSGAAPLTVLEALVRDWIERRR